MRAKDLLWQDSMVGRGSDYTWLLSESHRHNFMAIFSQKTDQIRPFVHQGLFIDLFFTSHLD